MSDEQKQKKFGRGAHACLLCGRRQGLVRKYHINLCRQCFREWARQMGFRKYT